MNTRQLAGGMKAASSVTWGEVATVPVMPHSNLWGTLLIATQKLGKYIYPALRTVEALIFIYQILH